MYNDRIESIYNSYNYVDINKINKDNNVFNFIVSFTDLDSEIKGLNWILNILEEAKTLGLDKDYIASMYKDSSRTCAENLLLQLNYTGMQSQKDRKESSKHFEKHLNKNLSFKALSTTEPLVPDPENSIINQMPFQSAFAYIVLDKYIPAQEAALYAIAKDLNFAGYAQSLFSPYVETIKSFNSASILYNLGSYISLLEGTTHYERGYYYIIERLEEEQRVLRSDLNSLRTFKSALDSIRSETQANKSLTSEQILAILGTCDRYEESLNNVESQLIDLNTFLGAIIFNPTIGSNYASFECVGGSDVIVELQRLETIVIDGDIDITTGEYSGGLLTFFNKVNADIQSYGDLAQAQQIALELELAAMQQQWTIVSGSLKLLNMSYRGLIAGIKGS